MNVDVERQLREYAVFLDSNLPATDPRTVIESADAPQITSVTTRRRALIRRPWVVVTMAVTVVLVALGGVGLFFSSGGLSPSDDPTTPTLTPPSTRPPDTTRPETADETIPGVDGSVIITARWVTSGSSVEDESGGAAESFERVETVWHLDAGTWRREVPVWQSEGSSELQGAITVVSDGQQFDYYPASNIFEVSEFDPSATEANPQIAYDFSFECSDKGCVRYGGTDAYVGCSMTENVMIMGFSTTQYVCSRIPEWDANELVTMTVNIDTTGRTLRGQFVHSASGDVYSYEVLSLNTNPEFDPALFEFDCPTDDCRDVAIPLGAQDHPWVGQPVPDVSGDLLGGGAFDIADHRGERVILLLWASWCPPCHEDLQDLEQLSATRTDLTVVTGAVLDTTESVTALIRDLGITLPVIDLYSRNLVRGNYLEDVWGPPNLGISALAFIDETGTIVAVHIGHQGFEAITQTLEDIGW